MYPNNYNLPRPVRSMQPTDVPYYSYPMPNSPNMPNQNGPEIPMPNMPMPQRPSTEVPPVVKDQEYLQGYLSTLIGEYIRIDFLIGTNTFIDKEGVLLDVGVDYIVIQEAETDDYIVGDLYSIKFVKVLR